MLIVATYTIASDLLPIFQRNAQDVVIMRLIGRTVRQLALCAIPITLLYSILRYKLWNVDILINRTLVYVPLTSILAGIFAATMTVTQKVFASAAGGGSEAAAVITTLVLTSAFTPIKSEIETFVDRLFKEAPDPFRHLNTFDQQVRAVVDVMDVERLLQRLLTESLRAVGSCGGAVCLAKDGDLHLVHITPGWAGAPVLQTPINHAGTTAGWLLLGARHSGAGYSEAERQRLQQSLDRVGHALVLLLAEQRTVTSSERASTRSSPGIVASRTMPSFVGSVGTNSPSNRTNGVDSAEAAEVRCTSSVNCPEPATIESGEREAIS